MSRIISLSKRHFIEGTKIRKTETIRGVYSKGCLRGGIFIESSMIEGRAFIEKIYNRFAYTSGMVAHLYLSVKFKEEKLITYHSFFGKDITNLDFEAFEFLLMSQTNIMID